MHTDDDSLPLSPPSLKTKLKNYLLSSCCFRRHHHNHRQIPSSAPSDDKPDLVWLDSKPNHDFKDEIKDKCVTIFNRVGSGINKHRRLSSADFRYDPMSYSLNFADGLDEDEEEPLRNFCSRLPPSPPVKNLAAVREITAVS